MIIDSHAHLVPPLLLDAIRKDAARFPSVKQTEQDGSLAFSFSNAKPTRPVSKPLSDVAGRVKWMDEQKVDRQVVGGWVDMFGYELPAAEGSAWSELCNEKLAEAAAQNARFIPLATVPLQDGASAARVLKTAFAASMPGAMIGTLPLGRGSGLDTADLHPFWKTADELGAVIHIHPSFDAGDARANDYGMANAVGRITDAMLALSRLIYAGHFQKYPNAKIVVGIGGAGLPFILGRLKRNFSITPSLGDPEDALRRLYVDTILHDQRVLRFVAEIMGTERIMMGTDMPFPIGDHKPLAIVEAAGFSAAEQTSVNGGLAAKLFKVA